MNSNIYKAARLIVNNRIFNKISNEHAGQVSIHVLYTAVFLYNLNMQITEFSLI